ncbi:MULTISPECIES: MobA/MobL family protein [unclassified Halomonas]|uniref:MobA/MobL family protein n=1 Tax=unclassified Halomonas TaxID=2609666 RepID=UPI0021BBF6F1|nr:MULTISPECIES: MobA/MobL family protein [unclassified Halomonas]
MKVFARLEVKTFSRKKGHSAVKASAYRTGDVLYCERTNENYDFTNKKDVLFSSCSNEYIRPEQMWNDAERAEKRKDSTIQREFLFSLDKRLSEENQKKLTKRICKQIQRKHGCLFEFAIHKGRNGDQPHAHILLTTRRFENGKFTEKTRELDDRKSGEIDWWRKNVEKETRDVLRHQLRKSLKNQGISFDLRPKLGSV